MHIAEVKRERGREGERQRQRDRHRQREGVRDRDTERVFSTHSEYGKAHRWVTSHNNSHIWVQWSK